MSIFGHQGDVFFRPVDSFEGMELGAPLTVEDNGGITLVEGELTGHHHQFRQTDNVIVQQVLDNQNQAIDVFAVTVKEPAELVHHNVITKKPTEEHAPVRFPAGAYLISNQRQMSHDLVVQRAVD